MLAVFQTFLILAIVSVAAAQESADERESPQGKAALSPMKSPGSTYEVLAGKIEVWENRRTKTGRRIPINFVLIPAKKQAPGKAPLFTLAGGPGIAATTSLASWLTDVDLPNCLYADRDVVLVDQRGTGASNALAVPSARMEDVPLQAMLAPTDAPASATRALRTELERHADLTQYGTTRFADDLDEVRTQLGYDKIDLWGTSYGTRVAQEYIRRYPSHVRSVVFLGSLPLGAEYLVERPLFAQRALERLIDDCLDDEHGREAFPELKRELRELLNSLATRPAKVSFKHPKRDSAENLQITRETFAEKLRLLQSSNLAMRMIPYVIHQAHRGNFDPFLKLALPPKLDGADAHLGLYLCISYTDDIPFLNVGRWDRLSSETYMGNNLVKLARQYHDIWPTGEAPSDFQAPVFSDIPALLITGRFDSLTPLEGGERLATRFNNSKHVIVPEMSHVPFGLPNEQEDFLSVLDDFFDSGTTAQLDASPLNRLKAPQAYLTSDLEFQLKMALWWR
jgi:pimeloyl-ACP methyl ester carboxylesterase